MEFGRTLLATTESTPNPQHPSPSAPAALRYSTPFQFHRQSKGSRYSLMPQETKKSEVGVEIERDSRPSSSSAGASRPLQGCFGCFVLAIVAFVVYVAAGGLTLSHARDCGLSVDQSLKTKVCVEMPQVQKRASSSSSRLLRRLSSAGVVSSNNTVEFACKNGTESTCSTAPGGDCGPEKLYIQGAFMISDQDQGRAIK